MNRTRVAAKRAGQALGASYRSVDRNVRQGARYTYRLQPVRPKRRAKLAHDRNRVGKFGS